MSKFLGRKQYMSFLFLALKHPKVVAIGEFGLDDGWCNDSKNEFANQERVFRRQIKLALKTEKPMVLHLRGPNSLGKLLSWNNIYCCIQQVGAPNWLPTLIQNPWIICVFQNMDDTPVEPSMFGTPEYITLLLRLFWKIFYFCFHFFLAVAKEVLESMVHKNWPIHMHGFTNSWEICQPWATDWPNMKFGLLSDKFDPEIIRNLPINRILLETDAPYFLPLRLRNNVQEKINISFPSDVWYVANQIGMSYITYAKGGPVYFSCTLPRIHF